MASTDLIFRFIGIDAGAGREFERMGAKAGLAGSAISKVALGIAAASAGVAVESVRMARDFQASMELIHTQAGATQAEVARMSKALLSLAGPTATAPAELAKGLYHLESAGFRGQKALEALKVAAQGAKIGGADLESVTNALNATLVSGIKGARDMSQAMGMLNATVGAGDMRMQDLADALGTGVLAVVKGFGVTLKETGAALAVFGDNNIRGADAATQLRMSVLFLAEGTKKADGVLKGIGLSSKQLRDDLATGGLNKALGDLHTHLVNAGDTGSKMGDVLLQAFGHKAGVGLSVLEGQFGRFQNKLDEVGRGGKNFASDWSAYTQTFGYSWDRAKSAFESMTIQLGQKLLPIATKAMNWIGTTGVQDLDKFGGWVSRNKGPIEDVAKALAAIAAFRFAAGKINDIARIFGVGSKALGGSGVVGGMLGKSSPIPVYVTNPGFGTGGPGGTPGGVIKTAEEDAKKYGPAAALGATWLTRAAKVATMATRVGGAIDPVVAASLVVGQDNGPKGSDALSREITRLANQFSIDRRGIVRLPSGAVASPGIAQMVRLTRIPQTQAQQNALGAKTLNDLQVRYDGAHGTSGLLVSDPKPAKKEIDALNQALADEWMLTKKNKTATAEMIRLHAQAAAAARGAAAWQKQVAEAASTAAKQARAEIIRQIKQIPGAWKDLAEQAKIAGTNIGAMLDAGFTVGITQNGDKVKIVTKQLVDGVIHTATKTAALGSPSKKTTYIGRMMADGVTVGITAGTRSAVAASKKLVDKVTAQLNTLRQTSASFAAGIAANVMSGASLANVPTGTTTTAFGTSVQTAPTIADITGFLSQYDGKTRAFQRNLALAGKKGLARSVITDIAQLGVDQGGATAAALAAGTRTQLRQISGLEADISSAANALGASAATAVYGQEMAALMREQNRLLKELLHATSTVGGQVAHAMTSPHTARTLATSATRARRSK